MRKHFTVFLVLIFTSAIMAIAATSNISDLIDDLGNKKAAKDASEELARIGKEAIPDLEEALRHGSKYQKRYAARAIRQMGQGGAIAIQALSETIKHNKDAQTREYAVQALGSMHDDAKTVIPILEKAKKDSNKDVAKEARKSIDRLQRRPESQTPQNQQQSQQPKSKKDQKLNQQQESKLNQLKELIALKEAEKEKLSEQRSKLSDEIDSMELSEVNFKVRQNPGDGLLYCQPWDLYSGVRNSIIVIEIGNNQKLADLVDGTLESALVKRNGIHRYETISGSISTVEKYRAASGKEIEVIEALNEKDAKIDHLKDEIRKLKQQRIQLSVQFSVDLVVKMVTNRGIIHIELYPQKAPISVSNFLEYADNGFYDGTIFHRVSKGFLVQGGGFTADMQKKETNPPIKNESTNGIRNNRGTVAMARTSDPDSATSQFFINQVDNKSLDFDGRSELGYAVFGRVIKGMEVVDAIAAIDTNPIGSHANVPVNPVLIESVTLLDPRGENEPKKNN